MLSKKLIAIIFTLFASVCLISTTQAIADEDIGKTILDESAGTDWVSKDGEFSGAKGFAENVAPEGSEVTYEEKRSSGEPVGFKKYSESSSESSSEEWSGDSLSTTSETTSEEGSKEMPVKTMKEKPEGMSQKPGKESPEKTMKEKPEMDKPMKEMPAKPDKEMPDKPVKGDSQPSDKPETDKMAKEKPTVEKPSVDKPEKEEISYEKPSKEKPSYEGPSKEKPSVEKPTKDDIAKGENPWGTDGQEPASKWDTEGNEPDTKWDTEGKEPDTRWDTDGDAAEWGNDSPSQGDSYAGGGTKPSVGHGEILKGDDFSKGFDHSSATSNAAFNNIDFGSHVGSGSSSFGSGGFNHSSSGIAQPKVEMPNNIFSN